MNILSDGEEKAQKTENKKSLASASGSSSSQKQETDARANAPKTDAPKTDAPKTDAPKTDAPKTETTPSSSSPTPTPSAPVSSTAPSSSPKAVPAAKPTVSPGASRTDSPTAATSSAPETPKSRRDFLKLATLFGGALVALPFVPFGEFLSASGGGGKLERQRIIGPDGQFVRVSGAGSIPPNSSTVFTYPRTGDPKLDFEPFRRWVLIRLPSPDGDKDDVSAYRAFSQICVHLWCLWQYRDSTKSINCPCHGSIYDPSTGVAVEGPATMQSPPMNALAKLDLEVDEQGYVTVIPPVMDVNNNGVVGRGRHVA